MRRLLPLLVAALAFVPAAHAAEPVIVFTDQPPELGKSNDVRFEYTASEGATFTCSLDDDPQFVDCPSPRTYPDLPDGPHVFTLRATDATGTTEVVKRFTIDTVAPEAQITSAPPPLGTDPDVSFSFTAEAGATLECKLDAGAFASCISPQPYEDLPDGSHTFTLRASDAAGNQTVVSRTFAIDTTAPAAPEVSGGPNGFTLSAEDGAALACSLDGGAFDGCASGVSYPGLGDGEHVLAVRATDAAGNSSPTTEHRFRVTHTPAATPSPEPTAIPTPTVTPTPIATPAYRKSVVLRPQAGRTLVRRPGDTAFAEIRSRTAVAVGTTVDVKQGAVIVIAATPTATETAKFSGGVFTTSGTDLTLSETLRCGRARRLTGDGAGAFRIRGRYAAATGRGAKWTVQDTCKQTHVTVSRGVVAVRDNRRPKTVLIRSGRSFTARPKR
jgi:hypothetical protein